VKFRQSLLGEADKCLRSLQYSIQGPPDGIKGSGISRELGTGYHAGLELFYADVKDGKVRLPSNIDWTKYFDHAVDEMELSISEVPEEHFIWSEKIPDKDRAFEILEVMLHAYFDPDSPKYWPVMPITSSDTSPRWSVIGTEVSFIWADRSLNSLVTGEMGERGGTLDLLLRAPDGGLVAVDHKTAGRAWDRNKHHPRKNNQAPWYVAWLKHEYPDAPYHRFCFDIMTYTGKFERRISDPDERHIEAIGQKAVALRRVLDIIDQGFDLPTNPASTLCSPLYCDHWRYCSSGAAAE